MIELFYFSGLDLMIKVEYVKKANSLRYASHREMENDERVMAEQYIMVKVAPKTQYYVKRPSSFAYLGIDRRLKRRLAAFRRNDELKSEVGKENEITESVNSLINDSMRNYYTEKIGDLILSARREMSGGKQYESRRRSLKRQMNDLLSAYNVYADHKVTLDEIIPSELKPHWPGLEEARCDFSPSR
jgi:hypothetical protein